jgi:hypothetical protein
MKPHPLTLTGVLALSLAVPAAFAADLSAVSSDVALAKSEPPATTPTAKTGVTKLWRFADQKSKNILWKARVPGWGLSHPIVVGNRVFSVGVPDVITCNGLSTGKQLWQRRIMPLLCDVGVGQRHTGPRQLGRHVPRG